MRHQKTVNIKELLETSNLAAVMRKGIRLNELNCRLQTLFPAEFQGLFRVANFSGDSLNIEAANAAVRQALLFRQAELLQKIREENPDLTKLNIKVNPNLSLTD